MTHYGTRLLGLLAFSLLSIGVGSAQAADQQLVLVDEGVSRAPIVLFRDAPPLTKEAAAELANYIQKSSGARPQIIEGTPEQIPQTAIWVGFQPVLRKLFPKLNFDFRHPEEILIAANKNHLVIAGRDRWDPKNLVVEGIDEVIHGRQQEYGTVNAIYTFLQNQLDIRWLWPGELGEDVPQHKTIALSPFTYRHHPQMRTRGGAFNFSSLSNKGYGRAHQWTRRQRLQLGSLAISGGHAFGSWSARFLKKQPELFALQPDGTRGTFPNSRNVKLCQSNPAVWQQWLADVEDQLKKDPNQTIFNASPNDGWSSGHCVCEKCRAWDHPDGEPRMMHWHKHREQRPALSDRHVTFANRLAELLAEKYPDKDYYVMMLAYGHSRPAPIKARPAENVIMVSVANFYGRTDLVDRGSTWGTTHRDQLQAWGKLAHHVMWRPNTGSPAGWQQGLPDLSTTQTIKDIQFVTSNHCIGLYIDAIWEHWATQGPQYYVMSQLIWDSSRDGSEVLNDYYQRAFGPAANDVRKYYETLEQARMNYVKKYGYSSGVLKFPRLYTPKLLASSSKRLQQAALAVADAPEIYRRRVEFVQAGLNYTTWLIENVNDMRQYWQDKEPATAARVRARWQKMEQLCQAHPFAINWGPVRPSTPRMAGLHPDHPHPKWKPGDLKDLDQN